MTNEFNRMTLLIKKWIDVHFTMQTAEVFRNHGSSDEDEEIVDHAFYKMMKLYEHKLLYGFCIIFSLAFGAAPLLMSLFMGDLVNALMPYNDFMTVFIPVIHKLMIFVACFVVLAGITNLLVPLASRTFIVSIRNKLFETIMILDIEYFDKSSTGVLIGRLTEDVVLIESVYIDKFMATMQAVAKSLGGTILAFSVAWKPAFFGFACLTLCLITYLVCDKIIDSLWNKYYLTASAASLKVEEAFTSFRTVKSFDNELLESELYESSLKNLNKVYRKTSGVVGAKAGIAGFLVQITIASCVYYFSSLIIEHPEDGYEPGDLVIVLMCNVMSAFSINSAIAFTDDLKKTEVSSSKLLKILEQKPSIDPEEGRELNEIKGTIEFRDVTFKYPTCDSYALKNLSFKINQGETVAIVGESGCGKSTTLQLIQRFYEPESGEILIDDTDIRTLSASFIRSQVSVVPQTPVLFSMSVKDNIRFSRPKAGNDEVVEAALVGNAHDFISEMPDGYRSQAQQTSLSGGQKQRICISRAIMKNSPILLLDEATAALDTESEQLVQQSIEKVRNGKTAIIVAHRLATVRNADRILVFKEGKVVESGSHTYLLSKGGIYADLIKYQLQ